MVSDLWEEGADGQRKGGCLQRDRLVFMFMR